MFPLSNGLRWQHIEVKFVDGHTVKVRAQEVRERYNFSQMGFMDRRTGNPNKQWKALEAAAEHHGTLSYETCGTSAQMKKRKQLLANTLKAFFGLEDDPFYRYGKAVGWRTRFKISSY